MYMELFYLSWALTFIKDTYKFVYQASIVGNQTFDYLILKLELESFM